ncbi:MAG: YigZ family protein [Anaerovoracaceae bacterium]
MKLYSTIMDQGFCEQSIEKSRFITSVKAVETKEEADAFIGEIKKKYKDATHNVPAMVIGDKFQIQWASDDGEPQGTSGAPIVQMLVKEQITNVAVVVTRYFGGIKLGTGGLVRAYTSSAKMGILAAGICDVMEMSVLQYKVDYTFFNRIQNISKDNNFQIRNLIYEDVISFEIVCDQENEKSINEMLQNITNGAIILKYQQFEKVKIKKDK